MGLLSLCLPPLATVRPRRVAMTKRKVVKYLGSIVDVAWSLKSSFGMEVRSRVVAVVEIVVDK